MLTRTTSWAKTCCIVVNIAMSSNILLKAWQGHARLANNCEVLLWVGSQPARNYPVAVQQAGREPSGVEHRPERRVVISISVVHAHRRRHVTGARERASAPRRFQNAALKVHHIFLVKILKQEKRNKYHLLKVFTIWNFNLNLLFFLRIFGSLYPNRLYN